MREPIDKKFSLINKHGKPDPKIFYTLPDGSTTIWLNEYVDAMVQAKVDDIIELLQAEAKDALKVGIFYQDGLNKAIDLINGSKNNQ
jgi:hypothetical protein